MRIWILANFDVQFYIIQRPWEARCIVWHYFCTNPCKSTILTICEMSINEFISHFFTFIWTRYTKCIFILKMIILRQNCWKCCHLTYLLLKCNFVLLFTYIMKTCSFSKIDKIQILKFRADFRIIIIFKKSSAKYWVYPNFLALFNVSVLYNTFKVFDPIKAMI